MKKTVQTVISPDKFYTIASANGKVVEVADFNTENGAAIQLWDYAGEEWQQWVFVRAGEGVYRIRNRFTGKMLDLIAGGVVDGAFAAPSGKAPAAPASCGFWRIPATAA